MTISIAAKSEEVFPTICTAGLLAMNISSTEVSEFIKGLSPDVLKEMWELDEYMIKSFDGVSYLCAREDMGGYRLSLQRDYIGE